MWLLERSEAEMGKEAGGIDPGWDYSSSLLILKSKNLVIFATVTSSIFNQNVINLAFKGTVQFPNNLYV
ncbi:hypothetical protein QOZ98_001375 [Planomicrobium stackebrandtii]|uniref:Uncharacterized protein n=1 Tax=Planomicrobium stackebrandtii TaxID=253160 RepID=A0ABU0GT61_9BACL|nr:hypothetical protein [Planomicrobium stackebrandtii]